MSLHQKLEQLYAAPGELLVTEKLSSIKPTTKRVGNEFVTSIDFTKGTDDAKAALGQPVRVINLGPKTIYQYKDMKITFKAGKVSDVE